jgi:hypothetical protein
MNEGNLSRKKENSGFLEHTMKVKFKGGIGDELINQQSLTSFNAITNKGHKVAMMDAANNLNLSLKFSISLSTTSFETLDCNFLAIRQHPFMHITKTSLA